VGTSLLQRILESERVEHGGQHAHVVAGRPIHPPRGAGETAEDVAGTDHQRDLDSALGDLMDLAGDALDLSRVRAVLEATHECFA
jgi:hypothetical protein